MKFKELKKEQLKKLIEKNNTLGGILNDMGIKRNSGNYQTLHRYSKKFNLSLERILIDNSKYLGPTNAIKHELCDILVKNSLYGNTHSLKNRLYNEGLKQPICEKCGQDEIWNGEKISLILDHINGIHDDNRLKNLRIVCPNCNATLSTHGGRNIRIKKKLIIKKKRNIIIESKKKRIVERPSHKQLCSDVSLFGYSATGRKYGVSDNAIRKWLKFYEKYELDVPH